MPHRSCRPLVAAPRRGAADRLSIAVAGALLSATSAIAVLMRIVAGALADRAPNRNPAMVALMMLSGAVRLGAMTLGHPSPLCWAP